MSRFITPISTRQSLGAGLAGKVCMSITTTGCTWPLFVKMSEKSLMTTRKKENRARLKNRNHQLAFIAEYTRRKYKEIYEEADMFYQKLIVLYPNKTKITTCGEFKAWELQLKGTRDSSTTTTTTTTTTQEPSTSSTSYEEMTPIDLCSIPSMEINIPLMNSTEVQETRDTLMFQNICPSLTEEINPELLTQIIQELQQESDIRDIFNNPEFDEDMNEILNAEINDTMNELSPLEKELLKY